MPLPNNFYTVAQTNLTKIDQNFAALAALTPIPVTFTEATSGNPNILILTPFKFAPTVPLLINYNQFTGTVIAQNTGPVTAVVEPSPDTIFPPLPVYKDTSGGPVQLTGGELVPGTVITLTFDQALNAGGGGFHLGSMALSQAAGSFLPLTGGTLSGPIVGPSATFANAVIPAFAQPINAPSATFASASIGTLTGAIIGTAATFTSASIPVLSSAITGPGATFAVATITAASIGSLQATSVTFSGAITAPSATFPNASIGTLTGPITGTGATFSSASIAAFTGPITGPSATFPSASIATLTGAITGTTATFASASIATLFATVSNVLPLTGGTLTGPLIGTSATFASASIAALTGPITGTTGTFTSASIASLTGPIVGTTGTFTSASIATLAAPLASIGTLTGPILGTTITAPTIAASTTLTAPSASITTLTGAITGTGATFTTASIATLTAPLATHTLATITTASIGTASIGSLIVPTSVWTPTDASGAGLVFTGVSASYTRLGNMVFIRAVINYPTNSSAIANLVGGLPFASSNLPEAIVPFYTWLRQAGVNNRVLIGHITQNASTLVFSDNSLLATTLLNSDLTGAQIIFQVGYPTSAP